jgi:hypothetical protein
MRRDLATVLTILGLPLATGHTLAAEPAPIGTTATMEFKVIVREKTKAEYHSTAIERVLNAECVMEAAPASQVGSRGPTPEQQAAMDAAAAKSGAITQEYAMSDEALANLEAEAAKCGTDEACLTALAMKMSQTPEIQAQVQKVQGAQQAMQDLSPDLGPVRYQLWYPQSCTGTMTVNDTYVDSDPGGEGGDGAYTDTTTASGTAPIMADWRGLYMETDLVKGTTEYRMAEPAPVVVPAKSSRTGAGERQVPLLAGTKLPAQFGPYPGLPGTHKGQVKGDAGAINVEWVLKK